MAEHQIRRAVRRDVERTVQALPIRGSHGAITQGNKRALRPVRAQNLRPTAEQTGRGY